ncbi:TonB-dependent receptor [Flavobacterium magnum]|uniref:TonB-dependent receptor n=1 Tax=Flavobacterium magnum TaxID=2162713 RepID=A0A2S0RCV5_9FLAO|nr:TonB-dependent receptor [Flavobacterium magnum]AWA29088.1 TonB-dependent receptor [Flavobacterium magnum]
MKKLVFSFLFVMQVFFGWAQQTATVNGKVVDSKTQKPLQSVVAAIQNTSLTVISNADGTFTIKDVPSGNALLKVSSSGYTQQIMPLELKPGQVLDLGVVVLEEDLTSEQQLSLITITENDLGDDNSGSESTSGLLQASRDAYQQAAAFNWGQARFRIRGLDNEYGTTMINGIVMNKLYDGRPQWGNWGGLNDATRNQEFTMGSAPSDYTFGGILGTQEINTRASIYRPGSRISFSGTNTNYSWRAMGTYASGMNADGWAYVVSAGRRWAEEGYFEGTNYSANSLFASVEKRFNQHHSLNLTSIYAQNKRGKNSPNTQEITNIAGWKYNSYWGYQDGRKRNSRVKELEEPIVMLGHYWKINEKNKLNTNVSYQQGTIGNSRIDFSGVNNPDPTYYRNLPSYFSSLYENDATTGLIPASAYQPGGLGGLFTPNYAAATNPLDAKFLSQRQLDWTAMYTANSTPITQNGIVVGRAPAESKYILYSDRTDDKQIIANSILNSQLSDNILLTAGVTYRNLRSHNYQQVDDLLGGLYFLDVDTFGVGDQKQSDLNNPDRQVVEGDEYGYNYNLLANTIDAFTQFKFTYRKFDFYVAQTFIRSEYQREGLYKNGYYPTNSFGKGSKVEFDNFGFKGGLTYKISGRNYLDFNGVYMSKAPAMRNVFPNARLNNNTVANIDNETITSVDGSYIIRAPKFKARITGYFSEIKNATETAFFFGEGLFEDDNGDGGDAFVAETLTHVNKKNMGGELGLEYQITPTIKLSGAAAYGQFIYSNDPTVSVNQDALATINNTNPTVNFGSSKLKDYRVAGTPQQAYSAGVEYRDPKFWWIGANVNYLADNYIDVAPVLRTSNFFENPQGTAGNFFPEATLARGRELLKQEKFDSFTLVNLTGGKSWRIDGKTLGFFASVNNVFDIVYKTGGFEQARNSNYRELNQDVSSGTPSFAPKYFYGYGRTYFVNLYLNF